MFAILTLTLALSLPPPGTCGPVQQDNGAVLIVCNDTERVKVFRAPTVVYPVEIQIPDRPVGVYAW